MTIKDLAKKTGYGVATVSRVLNGQPSVSETARSVILRAAEESGFQLNSNAKQLKQQRSNSILVVVKGRANELFSELLEYIQALADQAHYPLHVDYMDESLNEVQRAVQLCRELKPLGLLSLGGDRHNFLSDFHGIDIPSVLVTNDASELGFDNLSSVCTDDRQATRSAMDAMLQLGHRSFAIVGGCKETSTTSLLRFQGCMDALSSYGVSFNEAENYRGVKFSYENGYSATKDLVECGCSFTALFAASDVMAIGAIRALRDCGLKVPEDVSVMGFDGLPLGSYLVPQLSTVRQSVQEMAKLSVEMLLSQINEGAKARHIFVPFTLWERESTRTI